MPNRGRELAEAHWVFLERWLHMVYVDCGEHFYGHGYEAAQYPAVKAEQMQRQYEQRNNIVEP